MARPPDRVLHLYTYLLAALGLAAIAAGGWWPLVFVAWIFFGNAVLEAVLPHPMSAGPAGPTRDTPVHVALVAAALPVHLTTLIFGLWRLAYTPVSGIEIVGITLLLGMSGGSLAIVAAHEMVHRREAWLRGVGVGLLLTVNLPHFRIEHVHNHHRNVGTPRDPATARLGESVWAFIPRSIVGQYRSAWGIEAERLRRRGLAPFGPHNRMVQYLAMMLAVNLAVLLAFGWLGLACFLVQSWLAVNALETINYIEHYGLVRREVAPGKYEPFAARHAWNSSHFVTDYGLFKLGRHSAHHEAAHRPYPDLFNDPASPQLPAGYAGSYLLAMVPPLWRRVMDPKARAVNARTPPSGAPEAGPPTQTASA